MIVMLMKKAIFSTKVEASPQCLTNIFLASAGVKMTPWSSILHHVNMKGCTNICVSRAE